jgi:hypothetical protein
MRDNNEVQNKRWHIAASDKGAFDLRQQPLDGPGDNAVTYLSFWVLSSRPLDNLLLEPNVPNLDLKLRTDDAVELWLNGKTVATLAEAAGGDLVAPSLPLQKGWNHFLVRLVHAKGDDKFQAQLVCSQSDYFNDLKSAIQKP